MNNDGKGQNDHGKKSKGKTRKGERRNSKGGTTTGRNSKEDTSTRKEETSTGRSSKGDTSTRKKERPVQEGPVKEIPAYVANKVCLNCFACINFTDGDKDK